MHDDLSPFVEMTVAVELSTMPWQYAYQTAIFLVYPDRFWWQIGLHAEMLVHSLSDWLEAQGFTVDPATFHWHAGRPLLTPEDFA